MCSKIVWLVKGFCGADRCCCLSVHLMPNASVFTSCPAALSYTWSTTMGGNRYDILLLTCNVSKQTDISALMHGGQIWHEEVKWNTSFGAETYIFPRGSPKQTSKDFSKPKRTVMSYAKCVAWSFARLFAIFMKIYCCGIIYWKAKEIICDVYELSVLCLAELFLVQRLEYLRKLSKVWCVV